MADEINTGGGPAVGGNVGTGGGDFVGRDKGARYETIINVDQLTVQKILIELEFLKRDVADLRNSVGVAINDIALTRDRQAKTLQKIEDLERRVDPRWLRALMVLISIVLIVLLLVFTAKGL